MPEAPARPGRIEITAVALMTLIGTLLRILLWDTQSIVSVDGTAYIRMARAIAGGPEIATVHQYGYPALVALAHLVVPDWVRAARVVAFVPGVLAIPLAWGVAACHVKRPWLRLIPAAAMAFTPLPIRYSITTMTDLPYFALLLAMFLLAARRRWLLAGIAGGLAYTIRPESLVAVAVLALLRGRRFGDTGRLLAGTALCILPYVAIVGMTTGHWSLSQKTINISAATWEDAEEQAGEVTAPLDLGTRWERYGAETLAQYPPRALDTMETLIVHSGLSPLVLGVAGLFGPALPLLGGLAHIVFLPLTFIGARVRYLFPFIPFLWILSAAAIDRWRSARGHAIGAALLILGIAAGAWAGRDLYTLNEDGYLPELVEAGRWLEPYVTENTVVYDRKPYTAFYAGAEGRYLPAGDYDRVLETILARQGDYLVVNDWVARQFRPEMLPLASDPRVVANEERLAPIYFEQSRRGLRTVIYRVVRPGGPPPFPDEREIRAALVRVLS